MSSSTTESHKTLFAMRRANGDWFALNDRGVSRVPLFHSSSAAMLARSRETGMECFRPALLDQASLENLLTADEGGASFWLIADPLRKLSRGRPFDRRQLETFLSSDDEKRDREGVTK